jgi:hypothetical protein
MPATIDDSSILPEIEAALRVIGYAKTSPSVERIGNDVV